jgi:hypothetical protein
MLRIRMCGAVSPIPLFLAPAHRDNCTFYFYWSHAPLNLCANWRGSVGEQTVIMTVLTSCELCLYHWAGAVSCDCVTVCNLLLAVSEIWKFWLWRAWKIMVMKGLKNCVELYLINSCFCHHYRNITVTKFLTACMSVTLLLLSCMTVIFRCFQKIVKSDYYLCVVCL